MSLYEKIATVLIALLVLAGIVFSYHEYKESAFDQSVGPNFIIGPYHTVATSTVSGGQEDNCAALQPVLIGTLHDIKERLEHLKAYNGTEDPFQVNQATLQLLCNKNATITLGGDASSTLVLQKLPFARAVPPNGTADDTGTEVRINATIIPAGGPVPAQPTTFGDELIPDRYLDSATPGDAQ